MKKTRIVIMGKKIGSKYSFLTEKNDHLFIQVVPRATIGISINAFFKDKKSKKKNIIADQSSAQQETGKKVVEDPLAMLKGFSLTPTDAIKDKRKRLEDFMHVVKQETERYQRYP